jgi:hypothetical protein
MNHLGTHDDLSGNFTGFGLDAYAEVVKSDVVRGLFRAEGAAGVEDGGLGGNSSMNQQNDADEKEFNVIHVFGLADRAKVVDQIFVVIETVLYKNTFFKRKKYFCSATICSDSDICSAAPALADFQIPAHQVFGK